MKILLDENLRRKLKSDKNFNVVLLKILTEIVKTLIHWNAEL